MMAIETPPPGFTLPVYNTNKKGARIYKTYTTNKQNHQHQRPRQQTKSSQVLCANCGTSGHMYKDCNHPIISYGVICFKLENGVPKYLMVQRKDSLGYVEFIRGKYNLNIKSYIMNMFSLMTQQEREGIMNKSFNVLWQEMWCQKTGDDMRHFGKEFKEANDKFNILKKGYLIRDVNNELSKFDLDYVFTNTESKYNETEWGFPKGRRNINEDDVSCALREFKEETGVHHKNIQLCSRYIKPLEEVFLGSNNVRYKHVYYIAKMIPEISEFSVNPQNKQQYKEIRDIRWFTYEEAQDKIRDYNIERKELLKRLHNIIRKNIHTSLATHPQ